MKMGRTQFAPEGVISWSHYVETGENALILNSEDGEPLLKLTVSPEPDAGRRAADDEIWVRTWGENTGVLTALVSSGIATETTEAARCGYEIAWLAKLTPRALEDRAANQPISDREHQLAVQQRVKEAQES